MRAGAFCAHPLVRHLRGGLASAPAAAPCVRASGSAPGIDDIEVLADALGALIGTPARIRRLAPGGALRAAPVAGLLARLR